MVDSKLLMDEVENAVSQYHGVVLVCEMNSGNLVYANRCAADWLDCADSQTLVGRNFFSLLSMPHADFLRDGIAALQIDPSRREKASRCFICDVSPVQDDNIGQVERSLLVQPIFIGSGVHILLVEQIGLPQVEKSKKETISLISHELRTPLSALYGALSLLNSKFSWKDQAVESHLFEIAYKNSLRLMKLVNDLLRVDRVEAYGLDLDRRRHEAVSFCRQLVEEIEPFAAQHEVSLRFYAVEESLYSVFDGDRIAQVVTNLITNAIKHSPLDGQVGLVLSDHGSFLRFSVTDQGEGVPAELRERIFDKYVQGSEEAERWSESVGLGLSISMEIVRHHGGIISCRDRDGGGSEFYFDLPKQAESPLPKTRMRDVNDYSVPEHV